MVVNCIANTMISAYRSTMDILYLYIKYKCKEMWDINVNATYYDYANMICELWILSPNKDGTNNNYAPHQNNCTLTD